ncbi:Galactosylceramide sulfotransferase [Amphibalanus amphitrite]|uniref:Galactosylceramide sulfotransferase n=1 Tax=Amphibalanus amphitrite TaxID=1232801 RepID=A0A6A4WL50_AMPAM|nr:Galactosylceramide sulfotransferase [Amphibalanus amphitrite]
MEIIESLLQFDSGFRRVCSVFQKGVLFVLTRRALAGLVLLATALLFVSLLQEDSDNNAVWRLSPLGSFSPSASHLPDLSSPLAYDDLPARLGSGGHCKPRRSIFFLKTHKCGSSTVQNILLRHGERHALDFVLPGQGNYIGSPEPFQARWIPQSLRPRSGHYHIFTHHTRLNVPETQRVMDPDAAWVTILRDPVTQFESAFDYNGFQRFWNKTLEERLGPNQMAFDLGYDPAIAAEPRLVKAMLKDVENAFDLVMITELMDESLVLLRRLMCWSTDDVVSLPKNARFESRRTQLSAEQRAALEEFLSLDVTLYQHFRRRLADQIAAIPLEAFMAQAETLVSRRLFWRHRCVLGTILYLLRIVLTLKFPDDNILG